MNGRTAAGILSWVYQSVLQLEGTGGIAAAPVYIVPPLDFVLLEGIGQQSYWGGSLLGLVMQLAPLLMDGCSVVGLSPSWLGGLSAQRWPGASVVDCNLQSGSNQADRLVSGWEPTPVGGHLSRGCFLCGGLARKLFRAAVSGGVQPEALGPHTIAAQPASPANKHL
jgi:hypothetical protein